VQNQKIIILNGRKYDALTGKQIGGSMSDIVSQPKTESSSRPINPKFIDDFGPKINQTILKPIPKKLITSEFGRKAHKHADDIKRQLAKSKTLMRKPLVKPTLSSSSVIKPVKKTGYISRSTPILTRSNHIDSFRNSIINRTQTIKERATEVIGNIASEPPIIQSNIHERNIKKIESASEDQLYQQATTEIDKPAEKTKKTKKNKKLLRIRNLYILSGVILFLVIIASSLWYFKFDLELDYANLKTGLHGNFPSYVPLGYQVNKFSYTKNSSTASINIQYHPAHSLLNQNLYISETNSTLDNGGLVQTDIGPISNEKYSTLNVNGLSVYHYTNQYIWLNAGLLYVLTNQTGLDQPTVLKIINSI
jgi:hypothetical protein